MRSRVAHTYDFLVSLPDRLYPFRSEVEGQLVRGRRSYEQACARALEVYGEGKLSYTLFLYREICHFIGSVIFIILATVISHRLFGSNTALYVLLASAIMALSYQEFYLHPRRYGQRMPKGISDWLAWVAPMAAYFFFFLS